MSHISAEFRRQELAVTDENHKGEPEMQKLHWVGKFFNEWRADPPPPKKGNISPKKEISYRKRKSHQKT